MTTTCEEETEENINEKESKENYNPDHDLYDFPDMDARPENVSNSIKNMPNDFEFNSILVYACVIALSVVGTIFIVIGAKSIAAESKNDYDTTLEGEFYSLDSITPTSETYIMKTKSDSAKEEFSRPTPAFGNLEQICSNDKINKSKKDFELCVDACLPGVCCITDVLKTLTSYEILNNEHKKLLLKLDELKDSTNDCKIAHPTICAEYNECKNLFYDDDGELTDLAEELEKEEQPPYPPKNIKDLCSNEDTSHECNRACSLGACCYDEISSCSELFPQICDLYEYCPNSIHEAEEEDTEVNNYIKSIVEEYCNMENISTLEGRSECESFCYTATCCFENVRAETSCAETKREFCTNYKSCNILVKTSDMVANAVKDNLDR